MQAKLYQKDYITHQLRVKPAAISVLRIAFDSRSYDNFFQFRKVRSLDVVASVALWAVLTKYVKCDVRARLLWFCMHCGANQTTDHTLCLYKVRSPC